MTSGGNARRAVGPQERDGPWSAVAKGARGKTPPWMFPTKRMHRKRQPPTPPAALLRHAIPFCVFLRLINTDVCSGPELRVVCAICGPINNPPQLVSIGSASEGIGLATKKRKGNQRRDEGGSPERDLWNRVAVTDLTDDLGHV